MKYGKVGEQQHENYNDLFHTWDIIRTEIPRINPDFFPFQYSI